MKLPIDRVNTKDGNEVGYFIAKCSEAGKYSGRYIEKRFYDEIELTVESVKEPEPQVIIATPESVEKDYSERVETVTRRGRPKKV